MPVLCLISLLQTDFCFEAFLPFEEGELLELRPYKIGIFRFIGKGKPRPASDQPTDHTRVIPFSNKDLDSVLIFHWNLHDPLIGIIDLPDQISVIIRFKRDVELFAVLSDLMVLGARRLGCFLGVGRSSLDVEDCLAL